MLQQLQHAKHEYAPPHPALPGRRQKKFTSAYQQGTEIRSSVIYLVLLESLDTPAHSTFCPHLTHSGSSRFAKIHLLMFLKYWLINASGVNR